MFDPNSDPLGLGLKARARERRQSLQALQPQNPGFMSGPLPDENWDAFFQAVSEANPGKAVKFGQGAAEGGDPSFASPDAYGAQTAAVNAASPYAATLQSPSRQLGTLSLQALKRQGRVKVAD
jgi:hypothetical protein